MSKEIKMVPTAEMVSAISVNKKAKLDIGEFPPHPLYKSQQNLESHLANCPPGHFTPSLDPL